jgi:hypothetical protein
MPGLVMEAVMGISYDLDFAAWAEEQAGLLRRGDFSALDTVNVAEEIAALGRTEERELGRRVASLVADLFRWKYQDGKHCEAWREVIRMRRRGARLILNESPSLQALAGDDLWLSLVWADAVVAIDLRIGETLPETLIWHLDQILDEDFWPD